MNKLVKYIEEPIAHKMMIEMQQIDGRTFEFGHGAQSLLLLFIWFAKLTQEEDRDQNNKQMYKQKTVAFCNRRRIASSLWQMLVLCLSLLTGAHNNHIIWLPACWICACRVLAVKCDVQQASIEKWMSEYNHWLKIWKRVGIRPPFLIFWMYGFKPVTYTFPRDNAGYSSTP